MMLQLLTCEAKAPVPVRIQRATDRTARDGIRIARRIYATEPQASLTGTELLPGADKQSDDELDAHIRQWAGVTQHPVGTCAMGTGSMSVVDPELRVHGIERLRVVDASIMPTVPGGNTNAPTIMVAEKAADMILGLAPLGAEFPEAQGERKVWRDANDQG